MKQYSYYFSLGLITTILMLGIVTKAHASTPNVYFNGPVTGNVYSSAVTESTFIATPQSQIQFSQTFPDIALNSFAPQVPCSNQPTTNSADRPMLATVPQSNGTCTYTTVQGNGKQAGVGTLEGFDIEFTGSFDVTAAGHVTFDINHDDGWMLGIGSNGSQPTHVSGDMVNTPAKTPFKNYQIVGGYNSDKNGGPDTAVVNFPAAGIYPFELDYFQAVTGATLYLILRANNQLIQEAPVPTATPKPAPTATPKPTATPTPKPTATPTPTPTPIPTYTISGNVFVDFNKNKIVDAGESNYPATPSISTTKGTITANANGSYTINNILTGGVTVSYNTLPSGYYMTSPLTGPPPSFSVTVGSAGCTVNGVPGALCTAGNITNLNFGISNTHPWWQATCSDVKEDGIIDLLPAGAVALSSNASCSTIPGLAFTEDTNANFGQGQASSTNQVVGGAAYPETTSTTTLSTSYSSLLIKAQNASITPTNLSSVCTLSNCSLPTTLPHGIYLANGNVTLNAFTFPANQNYVILVNGSLTLNGILSVPVGSTALFSSSGNIIVSPSIGSPATSSTSSLAGWFIAGQSFIVNSSGNCSDLRLNIAGSVAVNALGSGGSLQNNRDLCGSDTTYPTVSFIQRLDMILNAPLFLKDQQTLSKEVAP